MFMLETLAVALHMRRLKSLEEANEISAVRLTDNRRRAKVGDFFRLSPYCGVIVCGRLIKRSNFFGVDAEFNLVYIYDAIGSERPSPQFLTPKNLLIGPAVVNNLGWYRGYWEIMASEPLGVNDILAQHAFIRYRGTGRREDYEIVGEDGRLVSKREINPQKLSQSGFGNFNSIDWQVREILQSRGLIPNA